MYQDLTVESRKELRTNLVQSNFNVTNNFGSIEICSRYIGNSRVNYSARSEGRC